MSFNQRLIWVLVCAGLSLLFPRESARAQDVSQQASEQAREHFNRGKIAYAQGDHELAIKEWKTAYQLDPRPKIQYNLAQAFERLGRLTEAAEALNRYIERAGSEDSEYLSDARAALGSIQSRLSRTGVIVQGGPEGASIYIDDQAWGRTPRPDRIGLSPGNHRVVIKLEGFRDFISDVAVPPGQVITVDVALEREESGAAVTGTNVAKPASESSSQTATSSGGAGNKLVWFIAAGAAGGLAVGSLIWFVERNSAVGKCQEPKGTQACLNESALKTERTVSLVSTAIFGVGAVAALVVGLVQSGKDSQESPPAVACGPSLHVSGCSIHF